jgi:hypothetical protein
VSFISLGRFVRFHRLCIRRSGRAWRDDGQGKSQLEVVVGAEPVEALEAAALTAMDEHVLAIRTLERADGGHHPAAGAGAVAGAFGVYVAGVEAIGAVVAVMSAAEQ